MSQNVLMKRWGVLLVLVLLSVSLSLAQTPGLLDGDRIFAWVGDGVTHSQASPANPGRLVWIDGAGNIEPVLDVPVGATRISACGDEATSPDGELFVFYVGGDVGELYAMRGLGDPQLITQDLFAMGCTGQGTFQFAPDSGRFAFLDYSVNVNTEPYPQGKLRIFDAGGLEQVGEFEQVTSFDMDESSVAWVSLFPNSTGQAVEAAITMWDGENDQEVSTLFADAECRYTSANLTIVNDQQLVLVLGQRCNDEQPNQWQFYTIDRVNRSAALAISDIQVGSFASSARTNYIVVTPDDNTAFFTIPDGLTTFTAGMYAMNLEYSLPNVLIPESIAMAHFTPNRPYPIENHAPVLSLNGAWLATVSNTADNDMTFMVFDLGNPALPPIERTTGERGHIVSEILFTPDSNRVVYVAGGHSSDNNSLFAIDLDSATDFRVTRGRYGQGVMSPDGDQVALMSWQVVSERQPAYLTLAIIDLDSSVETTLFEGATVTDSGQVTDQQFVYPLIWQRDR